MAGDINATVSSDVYEAGKEGSYTFDIKVTRALDSTSIIEIVFPSEGFSIPAGSSFACTSGLSPSCSVSCGTVNTLAISNFISSGIHSELTLTVSAVTNPSTVGDFPSLIISTYTSDKYLIDQESSSISFQTQAREIDLGRVSITSDSDVVYARAQLTLTVTPHNDIPSFSKMYVTMPPELLISSLTCSLTCTYYSDTTYLMTLPATAADDTIVVVLKNIRNPKSTAPTTSFQVRIMDASAILLQYRTTSISYSATQPAGLSITLNRNSTQNSARNVQY